MLGLGWGGVGEYEERVKGWGVMMWRICGMWGWWKDGGKGCGRWILGWRGVVRVEGEGDDGKLIGECFEKLGEEKDIVIGGDVLGFVKRWKEKFEFMFGDGG